VIVALGITWILDGLEVTLAGSLSGELKNSSALGLSNSGNRPRRKPLSGRCGVRSVLVRLADGSPGAEEAVHYYARRLSAGDGRNGPIMELLELRVVPHHYGRRHRSEYSAINSTIQELIPARLRGWTDLLINGSFGSAPQSGPAARSFARSALYRPAVGWRLAFLIGAAIGIVIVAMRLWIPESPRWLVTHGFAEMAEKNCAWYRNAPRP